MSDPYRERESRKLETLLAEERELLVRVGKVMVAAGVLGILAVLAGMPVTIRGTTYDWISDLLPGVLAALTLQAGLVLSRLPGGSRDYGHIERAIGSLRVVYQVKGVLALLVVGLLCLAFIAPMALAFLR